MVNNYRLVPRFLLPIFRKLLAPVEIGAGVLLLLSLRLPIYSFFSAGVASALARGLEIPCGCGIVLNGHVVTQATLMRNLALLSLLAIDRMLQSFLA